MTDDTELDWTLVADVLSGEASPEEGQTLEQWAGEAPQRHQLLTGLRAAWQAPSVASVDRPDLTALSSAVRKRAADSSASIPDRQARYQGLKRTGSLPTISHRLRHWGSYTALAMLGVAMVVFGGSFLERIPALLSTEKPSPTFKEYRTTAGQRAHVTLPDSTTIILAPQSVLRYPANLAVASHRTVSLTGQALFTVSHNRNVPFVVQSGRVATRVLGTSFTVRAYAADTSVQVVVAQGKVAVGNEVLMAGDVAQALSNEQVLVSRGNAIGAYIAWTDGRLVFDRVPLHEVIAELQRWYGVTVEVIDPTLRNTPVVATLFDTESATTAIKKIAYLVQADVQFQGSRAVMSPR